MINLHESMVPGRDRTRYPWICSQTRICNQTRYRLRYAARPLVRPNKKIAIRGDGKSPDQKVIDMQLQAANLVYIFDVIILSVTANKSGRLTVETSFLPLNSSKGGTLKC